MRADELAPRPAPSEPVGVERQSSGTYGPLAPVSGSVACRLCGGPTMRVRRRSIDRWINFVLPRWRYRCASKECRWEGLGRAGL